MKARELLRAAAAALAAKLFGWWLLVPVAAGALVLAVVVGILMFGGGAAGGGNLASSGNVRCLPSGLRAGAPGQFIGSDDVVEERIAVIKAIDEGAAELGFGSEATRLIVIAAYGESSLLNIDYGDGAINPDGTVADSIGILQQQHFWGTVEERMDPKIAAQRFITGPKDQGGGLADLDGWRDLTETEAIHRIQNNSDPYHYGAAGRIEFSDMMIEMAGIATDRPDSDAPVAPSPAPTDGTSPSPEAPVDAPERPSDDCGPGRTVGDIEVGVPGGAEGGTDTYPFPQSVIPPPKVYHEDGAGFFYGECTSYAMWKLAEYYGAEGADPSTWPVGNRKGGNGARLGNGGEWRAGWEARGWQVTTTPTANSIAWWGANANSGIGGYGHVAWVDKVNDDGTFQISEYNNSYLSPPGHKYAFRPQMTPDSPNAPQAYLIPPPADAL